MIYTTGLLNEGFYLINISKLALSGMRHYLMISLLLFSPLVGQKNVNRKNLIQKGDRYSGELIEGKRSGFGKYFYVSGNIYEGEWRRD